MSLTLEEVKHIAELARLNLTPEEMERDRLQLSAILEYAARLQKIDTSHIPPTSNVLSQSNPLREDEAAPGFEMKDILRNAPQTNQNQFRVPPVLE